MPGDVNRGLCELRGAHWRPAPRGPLPGVAGHTEQRSLSSDSIFLCCSCPVMKPKQELQHCWWSRSFAHIYLVKGKWFNSLLPLRRILPFSNTNPGLWLMCDIRGTSQEPFSPIQWSSLNNCSGLAFLMLVEPFVEQSSVWNGPSSTSGCWAD